LSKVIDYAVQIAEALNTAHLSGIVHRDIKSENIMVTDTGVLKVMDFGLAKLSGSNQITKESSTLGTFAYMSPEQFKGEDIDSRTDIWSFGVVLYEMLTKELPFQGEYESAIMYSVINENPKPIKSLEYKLPTKLENIIYRSIEKNPSDRYQGINEIVEELKTINLKTTERIEKRPSIAVLPFANMSADPEQEYFCDGMTEEIINALSHVGDLKVIARTSAFMFKNKHEDIRSIGNKLDVTNLLEGSIRKSGNRLRITAQLINVEDGSHLWSDKFDREIEDIFAIQDEISLAIVDHLKARLLGSEKKAIQKRPAKNSDLYNLYLMGRFYTNKRNTESLKKAIEFYEEAIHKEPDFALAYAGLSEAYTLIAIGYGALPSKEAFPKAKEAALRAIEIDDELAEAFTSLGFVKQYSEFDWSGVEQAFKRAIEINNGYAPAHQWYGEYFFIRKRWKESYREIHYALEIDPLSIAINNELAWFYHYQNKIDEAIVQYKKVVEMAPDYAVVHFNLGTAYALKKRYEEAIEMAEKAVTLSGGSPFMKAGLAYVYANSDRIEKTLEIRDELIVLVESGYPYNGPLAFVYVVLNEKDKAIKYIEKVYENKESSIYLLRAWYEDYFCLDLLKNDPWFNQLQKKIGLE
jgi:TolB-like protein/Tfp pilus assembly protein PilF